MKQIPQTVYSDFTVLEKRAAPQGPTVKGPPALKMPRKAVCPVPKARPKRPSRVLCVDDNVDACTMQAHILRLTGHGVRTAHTALGAIQVARAWHPDVVLLDIGLPEVDGYEVARRIRADSVLKNIKLVAITGYGTAGDILQARDAGFDAHLLKPPEPDDVIKLIADWKASRRSRSAASRPSIATV